MRDKTRAVLAVDLGGSKFIVGFVDNRGKILQSHREEWLDSQNKEKVMEQFMTVIRRELNSVPYEVEAAGIAAPGFVDAEKGVLVSMSLGQIQMWRAAEEFQKVFNLRTFINNDAKACALSEMWFGSCRDCNHFLYITASTGVGGAFILDGRLYDGAFGRAGEIGNSFIVKNGRANGRGRLGTLEMYASTCGITANYLELGGCIPEDGSAVNGKYISERAAAGDSAARRAYEQEGEYLGTLIAQACNMLDLERVVIGGGISLAFPLYKDALEKTLYEQKYWRDEDFAVVPTVLGYEGALIGAATVAWLGIGEELIRPEYVKHDVY